MAEPRPHDWQVERLPVGVMGVYTGYTHAFRNTDPCEALPGDVCVVIDADDTRNGTDLPVWRCLRTGAEFVEFSPCFIPVPEDS